MAVESGDLTRLLEISDERAAEAAIDGLWQSLVLAGLLANSGYQPDLLSYEAPSYYGMIVATYQPAVAGAA
jgi:aromatic ring-opening dioxygenase LigB subunit